MGQLVSNSDFQEVLGGTQKVRILLISDSPVTLYYDGEEYGKLENDIPKPIECTIGSHTFSVVSTEFPEIRKNIQRDCTIVDEGKTITVSLKNDIAKIKRKGSVKSFWQTVKDFIQDNEDNTEKNTCPTNKTEAGKWVELTKDFDKTIPIRKVRVLMKRAINKSDSCYYFEQPNTREGRLIVDFGSLNIQERRRRTYMYDCSHVEEKVYEYTSSGGFCFRGCGKYAPDNQLWVFIEERYYALLDSYN